LCYEDAKPFAGPVLECGDEIAAFRERGARERIQKRLTESAAPPMITLRSNPKR